MSANLTTSTLCFCGGTADTPRLGRGAEMRAGATPVRSTMGMKGLDCYERLKRNIATQRFESAHLHYDELV